MDALIERIGQLSAPGAFLDFHVDPGLPLLGQLGALKEDLLQWRLPGDKVLDVGWYPEFDASGSFRILLIDGTDWDVPLFSAQAHSLAQLQEQLRLAVVRAGWNV